jgi:hypothetical protein
MWIILGTICKPLAVAELKTMMYELKEDVGDCSCRVENNDDA